MSYFISGLTFCLAAILLPVVVLLAASVIEIAFRICLIIPNGRRTFREDFASIVCGVLGGWPVMLHTLILYEKWLGRPIVLLPFFVLIAVWAVVHGNAEHLHCNRKHVNPHWAIALFIGTGIGFLVYSQRYMDNETVFPATPSADSAAIAPEVSPYESRPFVPQPTTLHEIDSYEEYQERQYRERMRDYYDSTTPRSIYD